VKKKYEHKIKYRPLLLLLFDFEFVLWLGNYFRWKVIILLLAHKESLKIILIEKLKLYVYASGNYFFNIITIRATSF